MNIEVLSDLSQMGLEWKKRRAARLRLETELSSFTGIIDAIELHIPYTEWQGVENMINQTKKEKGNKILVLGGDSVNLDMFSFFYKTSPHKSSPKEEIQCLLEFIKRAGPIYKKIIFLTSNHEQRLEKILFKMIEDKDVSNEYLKFVHTYKDFFKDHKLDNVICVNDMLFQIGDIMFCHFENNSGVPGSVARQVVQYLMPRIEKVWNVAVQFHTHTQAKMPIDRKLIIEAGAMVDSLDYWVKGKVSGRGKLSTIGYARCKMEKGNAILNDCDIKIHKWQGYI